MADVPDSALPALYPSATTPATAGASTPQPLTGVAAARALEKGAKTQPKPAPAGDRPAVARLFTSASLPAALAAVRWNEPPAASLTDYASVMTLPADHDAAGAIEFEQAKRAMLALGMGVTQAAAAWSMSLKAARGGHYRGTDEQASVELFELWGDQAPAKVELARALYQRAAKSWPGLKDWLEASRLGSDPQFIRFLVQLAETRLATRR